MLTSSYATTDDRHTWPVVMLIEETFIWKKWLLALPGEWNQFSFLGDNLFTLPLLAAPSIELLFQYSVIHRTYQQKKGNRSKGPFLLDTVTWQHSFCQNVSHTMNIFETAQRRHEWRECHILHVFFFSFLSEVKFIFLSFKGGSGAKEAGMPDDDLGFLVQSDIRKHKHIADNMT